MKIEVSNGEIVDKYTILKIKTERVKDIRKLRNIRMEFHVLKLAVSAFMDTENLLVKELYDINCRLWDIEDRIRLLEKDKNFGREFIETARAVYINNDKRSILKKRINQQTNSLLTEEKSYEKYE
ncbi:hypothetical protein EYV94_07120 [Puteibacter caeruleilacunae]|nr:hypothetical protein EYV94_07120 [Puteibacter caeruleilacunae]